jgi:hypothetical protein
MRATRRVGEGLIVLPSFKVNKCVFRAPTHQPIARFRWQQKAHRLRNEQAFFRKEARQAGRGWRL